jgi:hypothetical protein
MLNEEVHITETVSRGLKLSMTTLLGEIGSVLFELRWFILAAFALILADLWFGIQVSRKKGLEIRRSSAGRRTFNKFIDYILYIVLGTTLAMAIAQPWDINPLYISSGILILCYTFEIDSIYSHICFLHGAKKEISIFKVLWLILTLRVRELRELENITINKSETDNLQAPLNPNEEEEKI